MEGGGGGVLWVAWWLCGGAFDLRTALHLGSLETLSARIINNGLELSVLLKIRKYKGADDLLATTLLPGIWNQMDFMESTKQS